MNTIGILYYTNNSIPESIMDYCWDTLQASSSNLITVVSQSPIKYSNCNNFVYPTTLLPHTGSIYKQILLGLKSMTEDYIYFCEHDVLYPKGYTNQIRCSEGQLAYNNNIIRLNRQGFFKFDEMPPNRVTMLSQLSGYRKDLINIFQNRLSKIYSGITYDWVEPSELPIIQYTYNYPVVDTRLHNNHTGARTPKSGIFDPEDKYWGKASTILEKMVPELPIKYNMPKTLISTCIYGEHDHKFTQLDPKYIHPDCDYIIITDGKCKTFNQLVSENKIYPYKVVLDNSIAPTNLSSRQLSRLYKFIPDFADEYIYTIYHDSNIELINPIKCIGNNKDADWFGFRHKVRQDNLDEINYCLRMKLVKPEDIKAWNDTKEIIMKDERNRGMLENGIICRKNSNKIKEFGKEYWNEYIKSGCDNDQILLPLLIVKSDLVFNRLSGTVYNNECSKYNVRHHHL